MFKYQTDWIYWFIAVQGITNTLIRSGLEPGTRFFLEKDGSRSMCRSFDGDPNVFITSGNSYKIKYLISLNICIAKCKKQGNEIEFLYTAHMIAEDVSKFQIKWTNSFINCSINHKQVKYTNKQTIMLWVGREFFHGTFRGLPGIRNLWNSRSLFLFST